jgi:uncharacterized protein (DUF58 family)
MNKALSPDILKKIQQIELYTQRLLSGSQSGDARSAQKGVGFEFDQLRQYVPGDDIRFIDWRASARMDSVLVKQYIEERSRTIMLAVDVSGSSSFSSDQLMRSEIFAQIGSILSLVAQYGKDRVGLLLFSDRVECYIPPATGLHHVRRIMQTLFCHVTSRGATNIGVALQHIMKFRRKDQLVFVLSDFICDNFELPLRALATVSEVIAVRYVDINEKKLPAAGFVTIEDIETGGSYLIDMRSVSIAKLNAVLQARIQDQNMLFRKYGVSVLDVVGNSQFMSDMVKFFRRRMRY